MARPTEPGRKHGLKRGMRDRTKLELSRLLADIKEDNHQFIRAYAKAKGKSVAAQIDEWIEAKRIKAETLYTTSNNAC